MAKKVLLACVSAVLIALATLSGCASKPFTVTFDGNGGEYISGQQVQTVTEPSQLVPPTYEKTGYELVAWDHVLSELSVDATVKALWRAKTYTITFTVGQDFTCDATTKNVVYDDIIGQLPEPVYMDNSLYFDCWRISAQGESYDGQKVSATDIWQIDADVTLVADWSVNYYKITYNGLEGAKIDGENPNRYDETSGEITLINPTKEGYKFLGWTYNGQTTPVLDVVIPAGSTGNRTYTANWKQYDYKVNFVVSDIVYGRKITMVYNNRASDFSLYIDDGESFGDNMPTISFASKGDEEAYRLSELFTYNGAGQRVVFNKDTVFNAELMATNKTLTVYVDISAKWTKPYA